jgi:MFS family permease
VHTALRRRSPLWLVLALGWGVFFVGFDQTFVVTALPDMISALGVPLNELGRAAWIVNGYLLGYAVAMPLMCRVADVFGRVRIYAVSIGVYALCSVGAALVPSIELLTVARVVQAIGGGAVVPIAMAIIADTLAPERRPLAIGAVAALDDASSLLGPLFTSLVRLAAGRLALLTQAVQTTGMIVGTALLATQGLGRFEQRARELLHRRAVDASSAEYEAIMRQTFNEVFFVAALVTLAAIGLTTFLSRGRASGMLWSPLQSLAPPAGRPGRTRRGTRR